MSQELYKDSDVLIKEIDEISPEAVEKTLDAMSVVETIARPTAVVAPIVVAVCGGSIEAVRNTFNISMAIVITLDVAHELIRRGFDIMGDSQHWFSHTLSGGISLLAKSGYTFFGGGYIMDHSHISPSVPMALLEILGASAFGISAPFVAKFADVEQIEVQAWVNDAGRRLREIAERAEEADI